MRGPRGRDDVLIFKAPRSDGSDGSDEEFWECLGQLARDCEEQNKSGTPFRFSEIPTDHPARLFARRINPDWEGKLPVAGE